MWVIISKWFCHAINLRLIGWHNFSVTLIIIISFTNQTQPIIMENRVWFKLCYEFYLTCIAANILLWLQWWWMQWRSHGVCNHMLTLWLPIELLSADIRILKRKVLMVKEFQGKNEEQIGRERARKKQNSFSTVTYMYTYLASVIVSCINCKIIHVKTSS